MRLGEYCFTPDPPSHFRSHISVWHPGYIRGEDTMFSLPRLDPVGAQDQTDDNANVSQEAQPQEASQYGASQYGVHFGTVLLSCQVIAGNAFETAYLSYDRKGDNRVQLSRDGILIHDHYFLHVSQGKPSSLFYTPSFVFICAVRADLDLINRRRYRHDLLRCHAQFQRVALPRCSPTILALSDANSTR